MIERTHPKLSVGAQCRLLSISRSSFYYAPQGETAMNLDLMLKVDKQFLDTPFYGVRQMTWHLQNEGHAVNEKGIRTPAGLRAADPCTVGRLRRGRAGFSAFLRYWSAFGRGCGNLLRSCDAVCHGGRRTGVPESVLRSVRPRAWSGAGAAVSDSNGDTVGDGAGVCACPVCRNSLARPGRAEPGN